MNVIRRFFSQAWLYGKAMQGPFDFLEFVCYKVGYSLVSLCFYCIVAKFATGTADLTHWVVGNAFTLSISECIFTLGTTFNGERYNGRLRSIIVSPSNKLAVIFQNGAFSMLLSLGTITVGFIVGSLIFGVDITGINISLFIITMITAIFSMAGLGLLLSVFALVTDSMHLILNATASLIIIFSGANFPVSQLPNTVQYIANIFPLYRSVQAANMSFGVIDFVKFRALIVGELFLGMVFYIMAFLLLKTIIRVAITKATLEMF